MLLEVERVLAGEAKTGKIPPLWDGQASERIAGILATQIGGLVTLERPESARIPC
jgi:hypothetical protein